MFSAPLRFRSQSLESSSCLTEQGVRAWWCSTEERTTYNTTSETPRRAERQNRKERAHHLGPVACTYGCHHPLPSTWCSFSGSSFFGPFLPVPSLAHHECLIAHADTLPILQLSDIIFSVYCIPFYTHHTLCQVFDLALQIDHVPEHSFLSTYHLPLSPPYSIRA